MCVLYLWLGAYPLPQSISKVVIQVQWDCLLGIKWYRILEVANSPEGMSLLYLAVGKGNLGGTRPEGIRAHRKGTLQQVHRAAGRDIVPWELCELYSFQKVWAETNGRPADRCVTTLMQTSECSSVSEAGEVRAGSWSPEWPHTMIACVHLKVFGKSDLERWQPSAFRTDPWTLKMAL